MSIIQEGMIITADDHQGNRKHNYLVLYVPNGDVQAGKFIQAISITSMKDKQLTIQLPIILSGKISYLVPYAIHSFWSVEMHIESLKGIWKPDWISWFQFRKLIMDLYTYELYPECMDTETKEEIIGNKNIYIDEFNKLYPNIDEYRNVIGNCNKLNKDYTKEENKNKCVSVYIRDIYNTTFSIFNSEMRFLNGVLITRKKDGLSSLNDDNLVKFILLCDKYSYTLISENCSGKITQSTITDMYSKAKIEAKRRNILYTSTFNRKEKIAATQKFSKKQECEDKKELSQEDQITIDFINRYMEKTKRNTIDKKDFRKEYVKYFRKEQGSNYNIAPLTDDMVYVLAEKHFPQLQLHF